LPLLASWCTMEVMAAPATEIEAASPKCRPRGARPRRRVRARVRAELTRRSKKRRVASSPKWGRGPLVARGRPRARHGVVRGVPVLRKPRRTAHRTDHRCLQRARRRGRVGGRGVARADLEGRFRAVGRASAAGASRTPTSTRSSTGARSLATSPDDTIAAASRTSLVLTGILADGHASALGAPGRAPEALRTELERLAPSSAATSRRRSSRGLDGVDGDVRCGQLRALRAVAQRGGRKRCPLRVRA